MYYKFLAALVVLIEVADTTVDVLVAPDLTDDDIDEIVTNVQFLSDKSLTDEQKLEKCKELSKEVNVTENPGATEELLEYCKESVELYKWIKEQVKSATPKVQSVLEKYINMAKDATFLKKPLAERQKEVDAVVTILNEQEKKEYMQLNEKIKEKEDEMLSKFMPEEEEEENKE
ncbi:unnamed protein product [Cylicocyclus nassatus]|uniref:Uncharacterized protein n=1 Tax=Cylicocyclus nassatus TaxID=53992 RepID=A0AA36GTV2_CYLNA|nr:unnamed protein product [Cylicocyclus nassatus]